MLRISHDCLCFEGCERHRIVASSFVRASLSLSLGSVLSGVSLQFRSKVTKSDLYLYDLIHPLFLNSAGEIGAENRILTLIKILALPT
jgi:hypothetical protein